MVGSLRPAVLLGRATAAHHEDTFWRRAVPGADPACLATYNAIEALVPLVHYNSLRGDALDDAGECGSRCGRGNGNELQSQSPRRNDQLDVLPAVLERDDETIAGLQADFAGEAFRDGGRPHQYRRKALSATVDDQRPRSLSEVAHGCRPLSLCCTNVVVAVVVAKLASSRSVVSTTIPNSRSINRMNSRNAIESSSPRSPSGGGLPPGESEQ